MTIKYLKAGDDLLEIGVPHRYKIGDVVFWSTASAAGDYTFIGHPKGDKTGRYLVLVIGSIGKEDAFAVEARQCAPAGGRDPKLGRAFRRRYLQKNPSGLEP